MLDDTTDSAIDTVARFCVSDLAYRHAYTCDVTCNISDDLKKKKKKREVHIGIN